jgi:hypothetical protein
MSVEPHSEVQGTVGGVQIQWRDGYLNGALVVELNLAIWPERLSLNSRRVLGLNRGALSLLKHLNRLRSGRLNVWHCLKSGRG